MTKKKRYRRYSPEFKRQALKRASEECMTDILICEELGISTRQLRRWRDEFRLLGDDVVATLMSPGGNEWWEVSKAKFPVVSDYLDQRILELKDSFVPTHLDCGGWLNRT